MKPLRTAILGCGRFARKHVVRLAATRAAEEDAPLSLEPRVDVPYIQEIE